MKETKRGELGVEEATRRQGRVMNLRRRTKLLLLPLGVLTALGGAGPLLGQTALVDKSLQVPDASFNGLDVRVTNYNILDNDFRCNAIGPITWTDHPLATSP